MGQNDTDLDQDPLGQVLSKLENPAGVVSAAPAPPPLLPSLPEQEPYESPVLASLDTGHCPQTVCASCPKSLWFSSTKSLKCFCRVMHVVTWSSEESQPVQLCDGVLTQDE